MQIATNKVEEIYGFVLNKIQDPLYLKNANKFGLFTGNMWQVTESGKN